MDKTILEETLECVRMSLYTWTLYFFKVDRRNRNPYTVYKVRFKNNKYLINYTNILVEMIKKYQLDKINEIKEYTGENTKISCDFIETKNELIKEQWDYFVRDIAEASDEKVKGKYQGYILEGVTTVGEVRSVAFLKLANPIVNLKNKRSTVFSFDSECELVEMSDEVCKLYMDVDCMVIDEKIWHFCKY